MKYSGDYAGIKPQIKERPVANDTGNLTLHNT